MNVKLESLRIKRFIELLRKEATGPTTTRALSLVDTLFRYLVGEARTRAVADISPEIPGYTDVARRVCIDKGWKLGECCPECGCQSVPWGIMRRCATDECRVLAYEMRSEDEIFLFVQGGGRFAACRPEGVC